MSAILDRLYQLITSVFFWSFFFKLVTLFQNIAILIADSLFVISLVCNFTIVRLTAEQLLQIVQIQFATPTKCKLNLHIALYSPTSCPKSYLNTKDEKTEILVFETFQ